MENKELVKKIEDDIEKFMNENSIHLIGEVNDFALRTFIRLEVESLLKKYNLLTFSVICDETNNTPSVIDNNCFVLDVYAKAEGDLFFSCINVTIDCKSTGISLEEKS